jgi:hypothetical protein
VVQQLDMLNQRDGWAVAPDALLQTTDGLTWHPAPASPPGTTERVYFTSPASGYAIAGAALFHTADAATTWQPVATPVAPGATCWVNDSTGWIGDRGPFSSGISTSPNSAASLFMTADAGRTWRSLPLPPVMSDPQFGQRLQCVPPATVWDLLLGGAGAGSQQYALIRSADGGQTWRTVTGLHLQPNTVPQGPGSYATALSVVDAQTAFLGGICGACSPDGRADGVGRTLDGGASWQNYPVVGPPTLRDLAAVTPQRGWVILSGANGQPSTIQATTDGGRTWRTQFTLSE